MTQVSDYELARLKRIEDNKRRMAELGLVEAAKDFKGDLAAVPRRTKAQRASRPKPLPSASSLEIRRSTRVAGLPAKTYDESVLLGQEEKQRTYRSAFAASAEEVYTQKHLDALGSYEKEWELFVDGYSADGTRIYDSVAGKTCHQCRQKTMGKRTSCSCCQSLQGQFCGDCLFMRYGENIDEVLQKPDWVCPVCRDLCNCSNHRIKKGWRPTGTLYRAAIEQGFKSVAHYLVLTNLEKPTEAAAAAAEDTKEPAAAETRVAATDAAETEATETQVAAPVTAPMETEAPAVLSPAPKATPFTAANKTALTQALDSILPKRRKTRAATNKKENVPAAKEVAPAVRVSSRKRVRAA